MSEITLVCDPTKINSVLRRGALRACYRNRPRHRSTAHQRDARQHAGRLRPHLLRAQLWGTVAIVNRKLPNCSHSSPTTTRRRSCASTRRIRKISSTRRHVRRRRRYTVVGDLFQRSRISLQDPKLVPRFGSEVAVQLTCAECLSAFSLPRKIDNPLLP